MIMPAVDLFNPGAKIFPKAASGKIELTTNSGFLSSTNFQTAFSPSTLLVAYTWFALSWRYGGGAQAALGDAVFHVVESMCNLVFISGIVVAVDEDV